MNIIRKQHKVNSEEYGTQNFSKISMKNGRNGVLKVNLINNFHKLTISNPFKANTLNF